MTTARPGPRGLAAPHRCSPSLRDGEPDPVAPAGAWYVGLDPASTRAGAAAIDEAGNLTVTELYVPQRVPLPDRLAQLRQDTRRWLAPIREHGAWCAVVEQPAAHHGGAALLAAFGVFLEAAASGLACPVHELRTADIDRLVFGHPVPPAGRKARLLEHARTLGYTGDRQDIADALACATAARVLTLRTLDPLGAARARAAA